MTLKQLNALLRVRSIAVDAAMRELASTLAAERSQSKTVSDIASAVHDELGFVATLPAGAIAAAPLAVWLEQARQAGAQANAALHAATSRSNHARAVLAAARSSEACIENLIALTKEETRKTIETAQTIMSDDIAQSTDR